MTHVRWTRTTTPAMDEDQQRQLAYLRELRESLRRKMIDHGQIEPA